MKQAASRGFRLEVHQGPVKGPGSSSALDYPEAAHLPGPSQDWSVARVQNVNLFLAFWLMAVDEV